MSFTSLLALPALAVLGGAIFAPTSVAAISELKQVHVITRHGARAPLPKNGTTLTELAGPVLTPLGQYQLFEVGQWLRQVYFNTTSGASLSSSAEYNQAQVRLESSDLDRTLMSANALSWGLFPKTAPTDEDEVQGSLPPITSIPVYSILESNDIYLRAYHTNCPVFLERLDTLYESAQWKAIESKHMEILNKMETVFPEEFAERVVDKDGDGPEPATVTDLDLELAQFWTYYDKINVARTECSPDPTVSGCLRLSPDVVQLVDSLTEEEFLEVEELMATTERLKFGPDIAGNLLGSPLLKRMLDRVQEDATFFLYSAHAPTLFSLMSTLQETIDVEAYPEYGSAIIMEVYQDSTTKVANSIRFVYKSSIKETGVYVPIRNANCEEAFEGTTPLSTEGSATTSSVSQCNLDKFMKWARRNTLTDVEDWCSACQNIEADVCMQIELDKYPLEGRVEGQKDDSTDALIMVGTFFGGLLVGLLMMTTGVYYRDHSQRQAESTVSLDARDNVPVSSADHAEGPAVTSNIS